MSIVACSVDGCERKHHCRSFCKLHYTRWQRHGDASVTLYAAGSDGGGTRCSVESCVKEAHSRSMCPMHYQRWRLRGDADWSPPSWPTECKIESCTSRPASQGLCSKHYTRLRRYGDPEFRLAGEVVDGMKICSTCRRDLPIDRYRHESHRGGTTLRSQCKTCSKKHVHKRRALLAAAASDGYLPLDVFMRDGWVCQLCGEPIDESLSWPHRHAASVDHIIPISKGGGDVFANVQASHLTCNISKGARVA